MKLRTATFMLLATTLVGCGYEAPPTIAGYPDKGMTQEELVQAAKKQTSTKVIGHLEVGPQAHKIPLRWVGMWTDNTAKDEKEFVIGLGRVMREMSASTDVEYCSQVCRKGNTWGAAILTIDSGRYCPITRFCPSEQWEAVGNAIHSHRSSGEFVSTPQDEALRTGTLRPAREIALEAERASKLDSKQAGWVVGQQQLWLVNSKGESGPVWDYESQKPMDGHPSGI